MQLLRARPHAPGAAVGRRLEPGRMTPPMRIADRCALPVCPGDVVAHDKPLALSIHMALNADGSAGQRAALIPTPQHLAG